MAVLDNIKRPSAGGDVVTDTETLKNIAISPAVVLADTIQFMGGVRANNDGNSPSSFQLRGRLSSTTQIRYERFASGSYQQNITRSLAEFSSGVVVERGVADMDGVSLVNVSITAIDQAETFILISYEVTGGTFGDDDFVRAQFTSDTNLRLETSGNTSGGMVNWQVVRITDGANVQHGLVALTGSTKTATLSPSVDLTKSFLVFSYRAAGNVNPHQAAVRGKITNSTTVTFDIDTSGPNLDISWFVIEMTDGTIVEEVLHTLSSGDGFDPVSISSITVAKTTVHIPSLEKYGRNDFSSNDSFGKASCFVDLTSATNVDLKRGSSSSSTHDASFYVIQWNDTPIVSNAVRLVNPSAHITALTGGILT